MELRSHDVNGLNHQPKTELAMIRTVDKGIKFYGKSLRGYIQNNSSPQR